MRGAPHTDRDDFVPAPPQTDYQQFLARLRPDERHAVCAEDFRRVPPGRDGRPMNLADARAFVDRLRRAARPASPRPARHRGQRAVQAVPATARAGGAPDPDGGEDAPAPAPTEPLRLDHLAPARDAGLDLIPLHAWNAVDQRGRERGKSPRDPNWREAQYGPGEVWEWAERGGNIGVRLGPEDVVLDFDPRNVPRDRWPEPHRMLVAFELEFGEDLSRYPCVVTGSGGFHFYARKPAEAKVANQLPLFPGLEFKGYGRQVVAPGSRHPGGGWYYWRTPLPCPVIHRPAVGQALWEAIARKDAPPKARAASERLDPATVIQLLGQLDPEEYRDHDAWLELMQAVHFASGADPGVRAAFLEWSASDPSYSDHSEIVGTRWDSLDPDPDGPAVGIGTLYKHVLDAGGNPNLPASIAFANAPPLAVPGNAARYVPPFERDRAGFPTRTLLNCIEGVKGLGITPRLDVFRQRIVLDGDLAALRRRYPGLAREWTDGLSVLVRRALAEEFALNVGKDLVWDAVTAVAQERPFNPIEEYLQGLEWDGEQRLAAWLTRYAKANPSHYVAAVGRLFLLGAVARGLSPGIKFDQMIVLEGEQGCGKSTLVRILGGEFSTEGVLHKDLANKDVVAALQGQWIVEWEELSSMRRADVEALKAFVSRTTDRARLAYERQTQDFKRGCVFVGTTNEEAYLRDATGNRRFLPVRVGTIDLDGLARDRDQLWAETYIEWRKDPTPRALELRGAAHEAAVREQAERHERLAFEDELDTVLDGFRYEVVTRDEIVSALRLAGTILPVGGELRHAMRSRGYRHTGRTKRHDPVRYSETRDRGKASVRGFYRWNAPPQGRREDPKEDRT